MLSRAAFTRHPVAQAELKHQWHVIETSRSGRLWIALATILLLPALVVSVLGAAGGFLLSLNPETLGGIWQDGQFVSLLNLVMVYVLGMNIALYLVVTLVTIALGLNSISRERRGRTWDNLLLTNVDARQLVLGKWWATLSAMRWDHGVMFLLRIGPLVWIGLLARNLFLTPENPPGLLVAAQMVLVMGILAAYSALDAGLSAAFGLIGALLPWEGMIAFIVTLGGRVLASVVLIGWLVPALVIAQSGWWQAGVYLSGAILGLLPAAGAVWGALKVARLLAVRQHSASPPAATATRTE